MRPASPPSAIDIRICIGSDIETICDIINDAAQAYKGVIPDDRWHDPYMPVDELQAELDDGVVFWGADEAGALVGVMGIQAKGSVALIRHAYVRTANQGCGIGTRLLRDLEAQTNKPMLIGTWLAARWAIQFYEKNGYTALSRSQTERLLHQFWNIPERQVETSVVLADYRWESEHR